jgi:phosphoglycolate phosphatase
MALTMTTIPFDIVGFDLDGTLLDTHQDIGAALNHALGLAGRPPVPMSEVPGLVGGGGGVMLRKALDRSGGYTETDFAELNSALLDYYSNNIVKHTQLYPGGEAMLDSLAALGVRIAVVTNKLEASAVSIMEQLGLSSRFFTIIGGDTLGPGKAKPARHLIDLMIERGLALGGGGRAAFVGDTTYDVGAARAAGIPVVAVSFGFNDLPPHKLGADALIHHFDELMPALANLD